MPVQSCEEGGRPGYRYGGPDAGTKCYTYTPGDPESRREALRKAQEQGRAVEASKHERGKR